MVRQLNKRASDWRTVISGAINNDRNSSGAGIFSTGLCIEWLRKTGLYTPSIPYLREVWKSGQIIGTDTGRCYTGRRTETQSGRYCPDASMNNFIKSKENYDTK